MLLDLALTLLNPKILLCPSLTGAGSCGRFQRIVGLQGYHINFRREIVREVPVMLMLTLDPGSSDTKIIWRLTPFKPELLMMSPEVFEVARESIDLYKSKRLASPEPENEAWVESEGSYYAVGFLAQNYFNVRAITTGLKYELAIVKVLAAVGAIALKEGLPEDFELVLAMPLPFSEWEDRAVFEREVRKALASFSFCDKPLEVKLKTFVCVPEGGGHAMARAERIGAAFNQINMMTLMLGYRDISAVQLNRGVTTGVTEPIGLEKMLLMVQNWTSGSNSPERMRQLIETIHRAGKDIKAKNFSHLGLSKKAERRAEEINRMVEAVKNARTEYWALVARFLINEIPSNIEQIVIGGGTADYLKPELQRFLAQNFPQVTVSWSAELEEDVRVSFNLSPSDKALCARLTDAYGLSAFLRRLVCPVAASTKSSVKEMGPD